MIEHRKVLRIKIKQFEAEAEAAKDKFNKGYFEGKAEMAKLMHDALTTENPKEILDILNGHM